MLLLALFFVSILIFSGSKSNKLTNLAGVAHNVLSKCAILILLLYSFYIIFIFFREQVCGGTWIIFYV